MEMKGSEQGQQQGKDQGPKRMERDQGQQGQEPKDAAQKQSGKGDPGQQQATEMWRSKGADGRPVGGRDADPRAWLQNLPPKFHEDAVKGRDETWPGKYDDLIRRWKESMARMNWK